MRANENLKARFQQNEDGLDGLFSRAAKYAGRIDWMDWMDGMWETGESQMHGKMLN